MVLFLVLLALCLAIFHNDYSNEDVSMPKVEELPEARIEQRNYAVAFCPACDAEHDVPTCGEGKETCVCGTTFYWLTVDKEGSNDQ